MRKDCKKPYSHQPHAEFWEKSYLSNIIFKDARINWVSDKITYRNNLLVLYTPITVPHKTK